MERENPSDSLEKALENYRTAIEAGILKILSKMAPCCLATKGANL